MSIQVLRRRDIFGYRPFLLYFIGHSISMLGNGMQFIANSWLALQLTGAGYSVAIVLVAASLPGLLLSPVIGIYVDRFDRRMITVLMDILRALVLAGVVVLWSLGMLVAWHLYLMSFLIALFDEIYAPAAMALIREVVPAEMLLYANSTTTISLQLGTLLGTALGGVIIAASSAVVVMVINTVSFLVSALCLWGMRHGQVRPKVAVSRVKGFAQFVAELREGIQYIRGSMTIIMAYLMMTFIRSTLYTINVLLAPFAKDHLRVGVQGFGYIDAAFAIGAVLGNFLLPLVTQRFGPRWAMTSGMWAISACLFLFAASQNLFTAMGSYFLLGVVFQVGVLYMTTAQQNIDVSYQGRVHSTFNVFFSLISVLVYLSMGFLGEVISLRWLYSFQGALIALAGLIAYIWIYRAGLRITPAEA